MTSSSAQIWQEYKRAILSRIADFSDIFSDLESQRSSGDGWVKSRCPFHSDKKPSFAFNPGTGQWCCFAGCGNGSVFDYLMRTSGKSFKDVMVELGDRAGVPRPASRSTARHTPVL